MSPFIDAASIVVDSVYDCDQAKDGVLTAAQLVILETWIAAHFYSVMDQKVQQTKTGDTSETFQGVTDMYMSGTQYGQTAIMLDSSGCLARMNKEAKNGGRNKIGFTWLGTGQDDDCCC